MREEGFRVARAVTRHAVLLLFAVLALVPATAFAFNPPDPNSPGHHYGEYLHNPHLRQGTPAPTPSPGGGGNGGGNSGGVQNAFGGLGKSGGPGDTGQGATGVPDFQFRPASIALPALTAGSPAGQNLWWVVVLLATVVATNVSLAVIWLARGGHYLYKLSLRLVPTTA